MAVQDRSMQGGISVMDLFTTLRTNVDGNLYGYKTNYEMQSLGDALEYANQFTQTMPQISVQSLETSLNLVRGSVSPNGQRLIDSTMRGVSEGLACSFTIEGADYGPRKQLHVLAVPSSVQLYEARPEDAANELLRVAVGF